MTNEINNKNKAELLSEYIKDHKPPDSREYGSRFFTMLVKCTEDIEKSLKSHENSMNTNAEASNKLAKRVFWLNIVLTVATVVIAINAFKSFG